MKSLILTALCFLGFSFAVGAEPTVITSVWVIDGDTVKAKLNGKRIKIRLANIDAPEKRQDYGKASKWALVGMVRGNQVKAELTKKDRYGRWIGTLFVDGKNLNSKMVNRGHAWVYTRYNQDKSLPALQKRAKKARRGLWAGENPIAPWKWRRMKK